MNEFGIADMVLYEGNSYQVVDIIKGTNKWGQEIDGTEALLYRKNQRILSIINTKLLKHETDKHNPDTG